MLDDDLVSIITPTWNCASFIEETIASVRAQTYENWEMIISDDCSTDNTYELVQYFMKLDSRIKYICNEKNEGAAVARNNALKIAKGRWIAFLDSDDLWFPNKLELQIEFMRRNNIAFSYTKYIQIDANSKEIGRIVSGPLKISKFGMYSYCWLGCLTVLYDSSVVGLIQIGNIKKNNDYAMWLKVAHKATCYLLDETLAYYRRREGSISHHSYFSLIKWHYKLFKNEVQCNVLQSIFLTFINLACGVLKKCLYEKKYVV